MLISTGTLLAYCAASALLVISPGPGQALVIARSIEGGARAGMLTALGLELGTMVHTLAAALGLSAILATSATAFTVVKYAGAVYLVILGVMTLRRAGVASHATGHIRALAAPTNGKLVLHGTMTGILNPKVALFFLAFLPQFVDPQRGSVFLQFVVLGVLLATLGFIGDSAISLITERVRGQMAASGRFQVWRERIVGSVLIGLGVRLAFADRR